MRRMKKAAAWLLTLALGAGLISPTVSAADSGMDYFFNATEASTANELFVYKGKIVTESPGPAEDPSGGTHYYAGNGNFSRYSSAHVTREGFSGEEPVVYDSYNTPYYVGDDHSKFESRSLYVDDYYMDGKHIEGKTYARWDYIQTFVLADSQTGELSTTYCADQITPVDGGYYNIENLEDAVHYTPAQARKIRTIAQNGYWGQPSGTGSLSAMKAALADTGDFTDAELELLTDGVAMTATQYAIWHFSNNTTGDKRISAYNTTDAGVVGRVSEEQKASVDLLFKVYDYLVNLDPESVENTTANAVITEDNFLRARGIVNPVLIEGHENNLDDNPDNDAYTADLTFTMSVLPKSGNGDDLVAKVLDANGTVLATGRIAGALQSGEVQLEGSNGQFVFEDLTLIEGTQELQICLQGHQELKQGVYLYTHEDGYEASQTLVGIAEGSHAVDIALKWDLNFSVNEPPERIVNIVKKSNPGGYLLEGIEFDFYFVADRSEYLAGKAELPDNAADYDTSKLSPVPDYTIVTDANGAGTFNLTENNLPDGVYLVIEREHPAIETPTAPFYVLLPATSADGKNLEYVINIVPKNVIRDGVSIEKDVIEIGNDASTQNVNAPHTWIIGVTIPADIGNAKSFVISDTLDNRLDFLGNVRIRVENANGTIGAETLTEGIDYTLSVNDADSLTEGKPSDSFTVSLTPNGRQKVESAATAGITHIRVYFDAQINANAQMGTEIPNKASLSYTNSLGVTYNPVSDEPVVYTGGSLLVKVDAKNHERLLPGAEFQLYRAATEAEVADETIKKVTLGDMSAPMVPIQFFATADLSGGLTDTAVSDENGRVYLYGLAYGTYYLVETKAPAGYNLLGDPVTLTIDATSHTDAMAVTIENTGGTVLPETGGIGTEIYTISGLILIVTASAILLKKRKTV